MHAYTFTHSLLYVTFGSSVSIHCIHPYYFDLRIYTNSDTTLHALTVDTTILETFGLPFTLHKQ
jgi:hypothetical protein